MMSIQSFVNRLTLILVLVSFRLCSATPIDNGVEGQPEVTCQPDSARLTIKTQKPFYGHVYVKGQFRVPECHLDLTNGPPIQVTQTPKYGGPPSSGPTGTGGTPDLRSINFDMSYRSCYVKRERSINPPGLSYTATVVVQFHHLFLTKVDRAYSITCFYMEATKTVTYALDISALSSTELYQTRPMPVCTYEVLRGSITGPPVRFAQVGEQVYHKWSCPGGDDIFGMLVHSCVAADGAGTEYKLIDQSGCSIDPIAVGDLTYTSDITMASVEVHVFKFADRMQVSFQCQISLCLKLDDSCKGITPPTCNNRRQPPQQQPNYNAAVSAPALPPSPVPPYETPTLSTLRTSNSSPPPLYVLQSSPNLRPLIYTTQSAPYHTFPTPPPAGPYLNKNKRSVNNVAAASKPIRNLEGTMDLSTDDIFIFNVDDTLPSELISSNNGSRLSSWPTSTQESVGDRVCLSHFGLTQIVFAIVLFFFTATVVICFCLRRYYVAKLHGKNSMTNGSSIYN